MACRSGPEGHELLTIVPPPVSREPARQNVRGDSTPYRSARDSAFERPKEVTFLVSKLPTLFKMSNRRGPIPLRANSSRSHGRVWRKASVH